MLRRRGLRWGVTVGLFILAIPLSAQAQTTLKERYQQGVAAFQAEQYQKSLKLFQRIYNE